MEQLSLGKAAERLFDCRESCWRSRNDSDVLFVEMYDPVVNRIVVRTPIIKKRSVQEKFYDAYISKSFRYEDA